MQNVLRDGFEESKPDFVQKSPETSSQLQDVKRCIRVASNHQIVSDYLTEL